MDRNQIEKIYEINGLKDYKLKTTDDLIKVHGIDFNEVDGYNRLDDSNRLIYEKFIVNIFNAIGLESRLTLVPKSINWVEDVDLIVKEKPDNDYFNVAGGIVTSIDKNGVRSEIHSWIDEDYKNLVPIKDKPTYYLRLDYEHQGRHEWLHIIKDGKEWY